MNLVLVPSKNQAKKICVKRSFVCPKAFAFLRRHHKLLSCNSKTCLKAILFLVGLMLSALVIACQPVYKSVTLQEENGRLDIYINAPKHVSVVSDESTTVKINWNADVVIPQKASLFKARAQRRAFSDGEILSFIQLLANGNDTLYSKWDLTKAEWKNLLDLARQYEGTERVPPKLVDNLQSRINEASENVDNPKVQIGELLKNVQSQVFVKDLNSNRVSSFLFIRKGNQFAYLRDKDSVILGKRLCENNIDVSNDSADAYSKWLVPDEPEISESTAYALALEYLDQLGIELNLYFAEPCSVVINSINKNTGWKFVFTRSLSDLQSQFEDGQWCYVNPDVPPRVGAPWAQEVCVIAIDKDGLAELWWQGVSEVEKEADYSSQPQDFDEIQHIITEQLDEIFKTQENEKGDNLEIKVTKVQLGISLIADKANENQGEYIPTWYVNYEYRWDNIEMIGNDWVTEQIMFSAIDGGYIEPRILDGTIQKFIEGTSH